MYWKSLIRFDQTMHATSSNRCPPQGFTFRLGHAMTPQFADPSHRVTVTDVKMPMALLLLLPWGVLGGYGGDPDGVNGSWEKASTGVSLPICVRVALATGEHAHRLAP